MGIVSEVIVGENDIATFKCSSDVDDNDIGKPVKLSASDTVALCSDGDQVYGFIDSVEAYTEDGVKVVGVQKSGRKWVIFSGTYSVGDVVEAATNTAAGVANAGNWGIVSTKADVIADVATDLSDSATGAQIATAVNANATAINAILAELLAQKQKWVVVYGAGTDASTALIEFVG